MSLNDFDSWILSNYGYLLEGMPVLEANNELPNGIRLKLFRVYIMEVCNKIRQKSRINPCGRVYVYKLKPEYAEIYARL